MTDTIEASMTIHPRLRDAADESAAAFYRLFDQLAVQAGGNRDIDIGRGFEITITVRGWKRS